MLGTVTIREKIDDIALEQGNNFDYNVSYNKDNDIMGEHVENSKVCKQGQTSKFQRSDDTSHNIYGNKIRW